MNRFQRPLKQLSDERPNPLSGGADAASHPGEAVGRHKAQWPLLLSYATAKMPFNKNYNLFLFNDLTVLRNGDRGLISGTQAS